MPSKFTIGDKVMYKDIGGKPLVGMITNITEDESGEPTAYVVQLDDGPILACSSGELTHLDLDKL